MLACALRITGGDAVLSSADVGAWISDDIYIYTSCQRPAASTSRSAMVFFQALFSTIAKTGGQVAAAAGPIPGLGAIGEIITAIIILCDGVPQNRYGPSLGPRFNIPSYLL
jgi:hypothetical protein